MYIFQKSAPALSIDGLDVGCERKKGLKGDLRFLV